MSFSVHNKLLNLCVDIENSQWLLCSLKTDIKCVYQRFQMYKKQQNPYITFQHIHIKKLCLLSKKMYYMISTVRKKITINQFSYKKHISIFYFLQIFFIICCVCRCNFSYHCLILFIPYAFIFSMRCRFVMQLFLWNWQILLRIFLF